MANFNYKNWDHVYRDYPLEELPWELGKPRKTLVDMVGSGRIKRGKALDLCCGAGTNTVYLALKDFEVTALDISKKAIKYAEQRARRTNVEIHFVLANFVKLPFKNEEFDFVLDMGCFHHVMVEDRERFIRGLCQVLKREKGQYLLICFSDKNGPAWNHFSEAHIRQYFSRCFHIESIEHFGSVEGNGFTRFFYAVLFSNHIRG